MPRRREEGVRRRELDDPAAIHHCHPVADMLDQPKVVRDEKVRQFQPILKIHQQVHNLRLHRHIQR
jgi:hypothetical protein